MRTNQERTIMRVSGNGEVTETSPRHNTNDDAQPKPPARRKSAIVAAVLVVATLVGWGVYHRLRSGITTSAGAAAARRQKLSLPVVEGGVAHQFRPQHHHGLG